MCTNKLPLTPPEDGGRKFHRNFSIYHIHVIIFQTMKLLPIIAVSIAACCAKHSNVTINFTCSDVEDTGHTSMLLISRRVICSKVRSNIFTKSGWGSVLKSKSGDWVT